MEQVLEKNVTILNLGIRIPQKDIIRLIFLNYLNDIDRQIVWAAHSKIAENRLIKNEDFFHACMEKGYLEIVKWIFGKNSKLNMFEASKAGAR